MGHILHQAAKVITSPLKILPESVQNFAAPIVGFGLGSLIGQPELGAALGGGLHTEAKTGSLGQALLSGGLSAAGAHLGGALFPGAGNVADALESGLGSDFGSAAANVIGGSAANASLGSIFGGFAGNSLASALSPQKNQNPTGQTPSAAFKPTQEGEKSLPSSLQSLGGLTPLQQATNVATGGVYGGGQGPDEQSYFTNLINRQLVDQTGKTNDISTLNPIENSYLKQLGLGGYGNSTDLLQAISKFKPQ